MLEELRENILVPLEERVERVIDLIHLLRENKRALETQVGQLRDTLQQRDEKIRELERRNAELQHVESELEALKKKQKQERQEVEQEKAEVQKRLEGIIALLNGLDNKSKEWETPTEQPIAEETPSSSPHTSRSTQEQPLPPTANGSASQ